MTKAKKTKAKKTTRTTAAAINLDPNVRAVRVYPRPDSKKTLESLRTVGAQVSREEAVHLATVLLAMAQNHDLIDLTFYRLDERMSDRTCKVTVTASKRRTKCE